MLVAPLEQRDVRPCSDAADTDDLPGDIGDLEALQQMASVVLECGPVGAEPLMDHLLKLVGRELRGLGELSKRDHDRRLTDDPVSTVDHLRQFGKSLQAVARVGLGGDRLGGLHALLRFLLRLSTRPSAKGSRIAARRSCSVRRAYQRSIVPIFANSAIDSRYARTDASVAAWISGLLKPLLRPATVKLADMRLTSYSNGPGSVSSKSFRPNSERPFGGGEHAEVREVRVTAELHGEPGARRGLEVGRHDLRRAPIEGERRDHHPPVAHRNQVRLTRRVLRLQKGYRVGPVRGRLPPGVAGGHHLRA